MSKQYEAVWLRKKSGVFCLHFQFSVGPTTKKLVWLFYLYSVFIFSIQKSEFEYKNEYTVLPLYSGIFVKKKTLKSLC